MRYERQRMMQGIGDKGQEKLSQATVVVVGCGGLGSPALTYLASAGIGKLIIIDCDEVSETNLNRQFLHGTKDIGRPKVVSAKERLLDLNDQIEVVGIQEKLTAENTERIISGADVVLDCVDNINTRILLGRECLKENIPLVEAGVQGFYGWIMSIRRESACLECMGYEHMVIKTPVPIIGTTAGVIGTLQANECMKIILGMDSTLFGTMLQYDGINCTIDRIELEISDSCKAHQGLG
ncbi:MAG: HesA/MoeB/ThiF family protein [Clostridiaceae bacterium]